MLPDISQGFHPLRPGNLFTEMFGRCVVSLKYRAYLRTNGYQTDSAKLEMF